MSSKRRRGSQHNPQRRPVNVVSMREHRVAGNVALADSPSVAAAKAEGTLGPNAGNLPQNVQSASAATNYGAWPAPPPGTGKPYPQMPAVSDTAPLLQQFGATGVAIFSGIITSEEYNPDFYWRDGVKIFDQMLRSDGQINAVRMQMEMPLRRATWSIEPASDDPIDKEIASFVESCLFHDMTFTTSEGRTLTQKWDDILRHALLSLWYGFAPFEVVWRKEDGFVKWARWLPLLPRTVWRWWVGSDNELVGIQQWTFKNYTYQFVEIPADKLLLFVHRQEGNNYEGLSLLRTAYKHWWYKTQFERIEAIGIERNAVVPAVIKLPPNFTSAELSYAQTVVQNIRANELGGITLPSEWDLEYPRNQQRYAAQVQPSIQYHDVMIARNVLAQFLNLGSTETGAYALADSQLDAFRASLQGIAEYIEDVINSDAIRRLVDYNYDGVAVYPKLKCSKIALQDMDRLAKLLTAIPQYLPPSAELNDWLAKEIGLPVAPGSPVQTTNPTSPSEPGARPDATPQPGDNGKAPTDDRADQESRDVSGAPTGQSSPAEGAGSAGGGQAGGSGSGGGSSAGLSEAKLLREAVEALLAHDAIERGERHWELSGHPPGYSQARSRNGQWAPGDGGEHAHNGGSGGIHGPAGEVHERGAGGSGGGGGASGARVSSGGGSGGGSKGEGAAKAGTAKAPKEDMHARARRIRAEQGLAREVRPGEELVTVGTHNSITGAINGTREANIGAAPDAHYLVSIYGEHQLGAALSRYSRNDLRQAAELVGVKPGASNAETISRITAHVTGGRYTADFGGSHETEGAARSSSSSGSRGGGARRGGGAKAEKPAEQSESIHETAARLQREGGLAREVRPGEKLTARSGNEGARFDPHETPDPQRMVSLYGEHQLGAALTGYSRGTLRDIANRVGVRQANTNAETISRITAHVTGGRYTADFGGSHETEGAARSSSSSGSRGGGARRGGGAKAEKPAEQSESIHERSARLQREGGLAREVRPEDEQLKPIQTPGVGKETALHIIDPYHLASVYGEEHLGAVLSRVSRGGLTQAAQVAGVKMARTNAETVSRITAHVTGGRYSANFGGKSGGSRSRSSSSSSDRVAARHEAKIARIRSQLDAAEKEYAAYKKSKGLSEDEDDAHTLRLREQIDVLRAQILAGDGA